MRYGEGANVYALPNMQAEASTGEHCGLASCALFAKTHSSMTSAKTRAAQRQALPKCRRRAALVSAVRGGGCVLSTAAGEYGHAAFSGALQRLDAQVYFRVISAVAGLVYVVCFQTASAGVACARGRATCTCCALDTVTRFGSTVEQSRGLCCSPQSGYMMSEVCPFSGTC